MALTIQASLVILVSFRIGRAHCATWFNCKRSAGRFPSGFSMVARRSTFYRHLAVTTWREAGNIGKNWLFWLNELMRSAIGVQWKLSNRR